MASNRRIVVAQALLAVAVGFNLDTQHSRVLTGPEGTHFGYSVALWSDRRDDLWLVVGAPRGASPAPANGSLPLGRFHLCSAFGDQCPPDALLPLPSTLAALVSTVNSSPVLAAQGIGFGETLFAPDAPRSRLLVCAPRLAMRLRPDSLHSRGACVGLDEAAAPRTALVIVPFKEKYIRVGGGLRQNDHRYRGYGMAGFSAALDTAQDNVFMGGPNAYFGQGVIARSPAVKGRGKNAFSRVTFGPPSLDFSSEGWATVLGRFDGHTEMVATSAPNANHALGSITFYDARSLRPVAAPRLTGSDYGAKFGYSLAAGDWDGDGAADLVAGAPLADGGKGAADAGAVHVYYAPAKTVSPRPAQVILGRAAWARFGYALACLGDVDQDGFDDLAVGAPFAAGGGSVHVFYGRPEGLGAEPTQVLRASAFGGALRGFGFSLDGGIDMDGNGYPDVIVGAAESDSAVFIRSAPVLAVEGAVTFNPPEVSLHNKSCNVAGGPVAEGEDAVVCLDVSVALAFEAERWPEQQPVNVTLQLDPKLERLSFVHNRQSQVTFRANLSDARGPADGRTFQVYIKTPRPRIDVPLEATASVALLPSLPAPRLAPTAAEEATRVPPVLALNRPRVIQGHGRLTCEDPLTCFSRPDIALKASSEQKLVVGEAASFSVELSVSNATASSVQLAVAFPAPLSFRRMSGHRLLPQCQPARTGASEAQLVLCSFQSELRQDTKIPLVLSFDYSPLSLAEFAMTSSRAELRLLLNASSDSADLMQDDNSLEVVVSLELEHHVYGLGSSVPESVQAFPNESLSLQELMDPPIPSDTSATHLGPPVVLSHMLVNRGPSPLVGAKLVMSVPVRVPSGLPLLYLVDNPVSNPALSCTGPVLNPRGFQLPRDEARFDDVPADVVGDRAPDPPLGVASPPAADDEPAAGTTTERKKRNIPSDRSSATRPEGGTAESDGGSTRDEPSHLTLSCDNVVCERIVCEMPPVMSGNNVTLTVSGLLVVSTMKTARRSFLTVESALSVELLQVGGHPPRSTPLPSIRTSVVILRQQEHRDLFSLSWLHYVGALTAGLFIVIVLISVLHKLGFFKRKRVISFDFGTEASAEKEAIYGDSSVE
ncbi:integrin alpha-5-like [Penaeus japonicus]|uniref:integrin alpha-5-like n=1 Tax=Penaeus japonicus TaxID=27405 RepID=UPI001C70FEB0|nr:integrin alpha-5-like [Penaeus japonicus]